MTPRPVPIPPARLATLVGVRAPASAPASASASASASRPPDSPTPADDAQAQQRRPPWPFRRARHRRVAAGPALLTLPTSLRGSVTTPSTWALGGVALVLLTVAVILGVRVARAGAASAPTPVGSSAALASSSGSSTQPTDGSASALVSRSVPAGFASGPASASTAFGGSGGSETSASSGEVIVHVVGAVAHPGIVRLPSGSRVVDAVTAAGGATGVAEIAAVNLARTLMDGEQLVVPVRGKVTPAAPAATGAGSDGSSSTGSSGSSGSSGSGLIDLNTATLAQLDDLPGVGPVLAQRILDWRAAHGRFTTIEELGEVEGIGEKALARLKPKVRL